MRALVAATVLGVACGRIGFELRDDGGSGSSDGGQGIASGGALDCVADAVFCDGFESGDLSQWNGSSVAPGGSLIVESALVHTGRYALQAQVPQNGSGLPAEATRALSTYSTGVLAVRTWVYPSLPLIDFDEVVSFSNPADTHYATIGADSNGNWTFSEVLSAVSTIDHVSMVAAMQGQWTCVELDYTFPAAGSGMATMWVGDNAALTTATNDPAVVYNQLVIGLARGGQSANTVVVVDDVVVATSHIGCL